MNKINRTRSVIFGLFLSESDICYSKYQDKFTLRNVRYQQTGICLRTSHDYSHL